MGTMGETIIYIENEYSKHHANSKSNIGVPNHIAERPVDAVLP
jgi:hypothetical protein